LLADHLHPVLFPERSDIRHYPKGFHPALARRSSAPAVGTVLDTIVDYTAATYPSSRSKLEFRYWRALLKRSIQGFDLVLTISESSRESIESFCDRMRIGCPPIVVTYLGARWENEGTQEALGDDAVLHMCSPQPHKRTDTLLEFWKTLQQRDVDLPTLRLVGATTALQDQWINRMPHVEHFPRVPARRLRHLIASSRAVIVSSEIEGFGLPALEGYYLETPAVYVVGTAVEEILGTGTPGGFSLDSSESFRCALDEALEMDRKTIRLKAEELRQRFSWEACAQRTIDAYRTVL
jgi:glycosyltransferase involved in cell wall biosynthesis